MLTTHRNQENLVYGHQGTVKQLPKTPGARFPKTPGQNDENATTLFAGKTGLKDGKIARQALVTPSGTQARAPLGNKTTNAKARTNQILGVKDTIKQFEKSQGKPTTTQRPKQKQTTSLSTKLSIKSDENQQSEEEPEYAPANPKPLPYESDVLPKGGLTVHGLKKENLLRGYYQHFHNPVDENGVSRKDKQFAEEMKRVIEEADKRNQQELDALDWGVTDEHNTATAATKKAVPAQAPKAMPATKSSQRNPPTIVSRRAASALSMASDRERGPVVRIPSTTVPARKPLSSLIRGVGAKNQTARVKPSSTTSAAGNAASRTTLGYNRGRAASSMVHSLTTKEPVKPARAPRPVSAADDWAELTITPARVRQSTPSQPKTHEERPIPSFVSMFEDDDDEDLPAIKIPPELLDGDNEEEEEFEFK
ncbi:hypothetical protein HJFPF1_06786 [Paramyrothecium foliicola]|nr:hypothetical protein HJFPF1_06786 [Paramyrothecium foliicola]